MSWYKTDVQPYSAQDIAIASQSPLQALSKGMNELNAILDNRAKEKYTTGALDKLKTAKTMVDVQNLGLDTSKMTKAGQMQYLQGLDMMNKIAQEKRAEDRWNLEKEKYANTLAEQAKIDASIGWGYKLSQLPEEERYKAFEKLQDNQGGLKMGMIGNILQKREDVEYNQRMTQDRFNFQKNQFYNTEKRLKENNMLQMLQPFVKQAQQVLMSDYTSLEQKQQAKLFIDSYKTKAGIDVPSFVQNETTTVANKDNIAVPTSSGMSYENINTSIKALEQSINKAKKDPYGKARVVAMEQRMNELNSVKKWYSGEENAKTAIINLYMKDGKNPMSKDVAQKALTTDMSKVYNAISNKINALDTDGTLSGSWHYITDFFGLGSDSTKGQRELFFNHMIPQAIENFAKINNGRYPNDKEVIRMMKDVNDIEEGMVHVFGKKDYTYTNYNSGKISPMGYAVAQTVVKFMETKQEQEKREQEIDRSKSQEKYLEGIKASALSNQKMLGN